MTVVLDASALLAYFRREPGGEQVAELLTDEARVSTLNWSELHQKLTWYGLAADDLTASLRTLGVQVEPFNRADAVAASNLYPQTRWPGGASLADRACLALARRLGAPAYTADREWSGINVGVDVRVIR